MGEPNDASNNERMNESIIKTVCWHWSTSEFADRFDSWKLSEAGNWSSL